MRMDGALGVAVLVDALKSTGSSWVVPRRPDERDSSEE
jgi:hypothetical protein